MKMDKNRFETQKEVVNLDPTVHNIQALFTVDDLKWLMEQAEKVEELESNNYEAMAWQAVEISKLNEKIAELEKEIEEHCETKGLLGRQVFALTKRVDELTEENKKLKEMNEVVKEYNSMYLKEISALRNDVKLLESENEKIKQELIHYLGELKMLYTRQDSKRFCEEKIHKLKNS